MKVAVARVVGFLKMHETRSLMLQSSGEMNATRSFLVVVISVCVCVCVCISALLLVRFEGYLLASAFFKLDVQGLSLGCNPAA